MVSYKTLITILVLICLVNMKSKSTEAASQSLVAQCSPAITAVTSCLGYASGKAPEPTKDCCSAVSSMKEKEPVCLCFFIGQAHNGSEQIKSLGIQEAKLIQLPTACQLNATISKCPELLGISPSSPAAAIFMHTNTTSPTGGASSTMATPAGGDNNSSGIKLEYGSLLGRLVITALILVTLLASFS